MKKGICLLLLAALLLVSCTTAPEESASVSETQSESVSSETESEVSTVFEESELVGEINAFFGENVPDRGMKATNLLADLTYTYSESPVESYPDPDMKKLTDGAIRDLFDNFSWVSFKSGTTPSITFDLGGTEHALADLEVYMLRQIDYGIELPRAVELSLSDDGENFTLVSTLQTPDDLSESSHYTYRFALPQTVSARYIRVTLQRKADNFLFIDEIVGYEYSENGTIDVSGGQSSGDEGKEYDYYGYKLNTDITVPVDPSDADYDTYRNLALLEGVDVQVQHFDPMPEGHLASNTAIDALAMLIDGKKANLASYNDAAYAHFYRGDGRHIVVDLGNEMAVDAVNTEFLNQISVGVGVPPAVMVNVSNDGVHWVSVSSEYTGHYGDKQDRIATIEGKFKQAYRCRYVRVSFATVPDNAVSSNVYLSEIEVLGKKNAEGVPEAEYDPDLRWGNFPDPSIIGAENILLAAVNGKIGDENCGVLTEQYAKYVLAYHDIDGNIKDTFFDSFLFAPTMRFAFQSDVADSFELFADELWHEGQNLRALENMAKEVGDALNTAVKPTVWLNLMCPKTNEICRDVDGDGKAEDFSTLEGRFAYLKYQVDRYLTLWGDSAFENLELLGFYWNDEALRREELALNTGSIKMINDYIHSLGYKSIWCPYYDAYGTWMWEEVGFDFASWQPNYMFYATEPTRLYSTSSKAKIYGMGVELEIEDYTSDGSINMYRDYLREGYDSGFMNSIKLYYHGGFPGAFLGSGLSGDERLRAVYEDTYLFAKRKPDDTFHVGVGNDLSQFEDIALKVVHGKTVEFELSDTSDYTVRIVQSPLFGAIRLDLGGKGVYRAMKGYRGTDTVVLEISDGAGNKKTVTVTVTVTE